MNELDILRITLLHFEMYADDKLLYMGICDVICIVANKDPNTDVTRIIPKFNHKYITELCKNNNLEQPYPGINVKMDFWWSPNDKIIRRNVLRLLIAEYECE